MFDKLRARITTGRIQVIPPVAAGPQPASDDPLRAFASWAMERAEGICWLRATEDLDAAFAALARDLPELTRSGVRWSGAGVLHRTGVEWFAFEGGGRSVLVFAMGEHPDLAARQMAVLRALSGHDVSTIAGGVVPDALLQDLRGTIGVPVWRIAGLGGTTEEALGVAA